MKRAVLFAVLKLLCPLFLALCAAAVICICLARGSAQTDHAAGHLCAAEENIRADITAVQDNAAGETSAGGGQAGTSAEAWSAEWESERDLSDEIPVDDAHFPDAAFRSWLTDAGNLDGMGSDGIFTRAELESVTKIYQNGQTTPFTSLEGIEYFPNLQELSVRNNTIDVLDLSENPALTYVNCPYNRLKELNVTGLEHLRTLICEYNSLTSLTFSQNTSLIMLYCRHNSLASVDFSGSPNLVFIETFDNYLTQVDVSMLADLEFLHIDHNKLTCLDMSHNPNLKGGGFVVRNNDMRELKLPDIEGFTVYFDDFAEQDPIEGYERHAWYFDAEFLLPVTGDVEADGQTLYGKRIPNDYTVFFSANGGSGAPSSVAAQYGVEGRLPSQTPVRAGYVFTGWKTFGGQKLYGAGDAFISLAGSKRNGESVTLYAQWKANRYTIRFHANAADAAGTMASETAEYGVAFPLPENGFSRDGYDFCGWALTPDGDAVLTDRQAALNLCKDDGAFADLYAVWEPNAESVQAPYLAEIDAKMDALSVGEYFTEDWNGIAALYAEAVGAVRGAEKDSARMRRAVDAFAASASEIMDRSERVTEIVGGWDARYAERLAGVFAPPVPSGEGTAAYAAVKAALADTEQTRLEAFSTLTEHESAKTAALLARERLSEKIATLTAFLPAGAWLEQAETLGAVSVSDVRSAQYSEYESLVREYHRMTDPQRAYIAETTFSDLFVRMRIADAKMNAVALLAAQYDRYVSSDYSAEAWERLTSAYLTGVEQAEQAQTEEILYDIVGQCSAAMEEIPTADETPAPPPDDPPSEDKPSDSTPDTPSEEPDAGQTPDGDASVGTDGVPADDPTVWIWVGVGCAVAAAAAGAVLFVTLRRRRK